MTMKPDEGEQHKILPSILDDMEENISSGGRGSESESLDRRYKNG